MLLTWLGCLWPLICMRYHIRMEWSDGRRSLAGARKQQHSGTQYYTIRSGKIKRPFDVWRVARLCTHAAIDPPNSNQIFICFCFYDEKLFSASTRQAVDTTIGLNRFEAKYERIDELKCVQSRLFSANDFIIFFFICEFLIRNSTWPC